MRRATLRLRQFVFHRTGTSAVEFACVAPIFFVLIFGLVFFAIVFSISCGLQQLAAEAARASVAGLSDPERAQIVQDFVSRHVADYPFVAPQKLTLATSSETVPTATFQVSLSYDLTNQAVATFGSFLPFVPTALHRTAVVTVASAL